VRCAHGQASETYRCDQLYHHQFLYQLYLQADPHYTGRVTVPVLWDKKRIIVACACAQAIKRGIEHADNFSRLIADDGLLLTTGCIKPVSPPASRPMTKP
jgi:glutathionyl-hydroquinone reductase